MSLFSVPTHWTLSNHISFMPLIKPPVRALPPVMHEEEEDDDDVHV